MSELFQNAIISIKLGVEDYQTGNDDRIISAVRNYYSGLLLLAKECLVKATPGVDPMIAISSKLEPVPDGNCGINYKVIGNTTINCPETIKRLKKFYPNQNWASNNLEALQKLRNEVEHYHLKEPTNKLRQVMESSFSIVEVFFKILNKDPEDYLSDVWDTILLKDKQTVDSKSGVFKEDSNNNDKWFDANISDFVTGFVNKKPDGDNSYSAVDVARFRLLACSVSQHGNDQNLLGIHDANLIYRDLRNIDLSFQERRGLIKTAFENLDSFTVPLWHWIFQRNNTIKSEIPFFTLIGEEKRRCNTFKLLGMLNVAPKDFNIRRYNSAKFRDLWFSENVSDNLVISALEYLGIVGDDDVKTNWEQLIGSSREHISHAAIRSLARIKLRTNRTDALRFVSEHENVDFGDELTEEVLSNIDIIEPEILRSCLNNVTRSLKQKVTNELFERNELIKSDANFLCGNVDPYIRLIGVKVLEKYNPEIELSMVESILVKSEKSMGMGRFNDSGRDEFREYKINTLIRIPHQDLLDIKKNETLYEYEATIALYQGHFEEEKIDLETNLLNGFEDFCSNRRDRLDDILKTVYDQDQISSQSFLEELTYNHIRINLLQLSLEIFCSKIDRSGILIVREVMDKHDIILSTKVISFIAKYGEWEDVSRIIKLSKKTMRLSFVSHDNYFVEDQLTARTILKFGAKRISDVCKFDIPDDVWIQIFVQMSKKMFIELDDHIIIDMLLRDNDIVRETVALRSVLCLPKKRLKKLLDDYCSIDSHYYNTIFWLDLGVSATQKIGRVIAQDVIRKK